MSVSDRKLDDAARAAWLSYVGGKKQDEIAQIMGISRQSAQRLVSQAHSAGLVKVRIDHPIARCMELAARLKERWGLTHCDVVPSLDGSAESGWAVATATSKLLESWLTKPDAIIIGLGTGRTLRGAIESLPHVACEQHRIVSLTGNISRDGSTATYNVLFTVSEKVSAQTFPLPLPVISANVEERGALLSQQMLANTLDLARQTDVRLIGIGDMIHSAPLVMDGFILPEDQERLRAKGAVGEVIGWVFDAEGRLVDDEINARVSSTDMPANPEVPTIAAAFGAEKTQAIRGALTGCLINGLITDEETALALTA